MLQRPSRRPVRALIVDDQIIIRNLLRALLTKTGFSIIGESNNGEKALVMADQLKPELVCLDITMPGMSGLETLKRLKQSYPQTKAYWPTPWMLRALAQGWILSPTVKARPAALKYRIMAREFPTSICSGFLIPSLRLSPRERNGPGFVTGLSDSQTG